MTRNEYLTRLRTALLEQRVADAEDIVSEYEAHFDFKLADGFSEEEIAARLGAPEALAAQFESGAGKPKGAGKIPTVIALCFADLVVFCFFVLLFAWTLVLAVFACCCIVLAGYLLAGANLHSLIPPMPYWCGAVFAVALLALGVLSLTGCVYYTAFVRQLLRSYLRWHHNASPRPPVRRCCPVSPSSHSFQRSETAACAPLRSFRSRSSSCPLCWV